MSCITEGPFSQTLFLGCSVRSFTMSAAWGADASTCNVGLIHDPVPPIGSAQYQPFKTRIQSITNKTKGIDTTSTAFDTKDLNPNNDPSKSLFRHAAKKIKEKHDDEQNLGNKAYKVGYSADTGGKKYWYWGDPGFIPTFGDTDIIGCPVNFQFEGLGFAGLIKNWTTNIQGLIDVEIQSFANLLKNTTMILQKFRGSVSTLIPGTQTFGVAGNISYDVAIPSLEMDGGYNGTINQGNSPNVVNVFGYLESFGLGNSNWSKARGIPANAIYDALVYLLGSSSPNKGNYSPYGGLVAKAPFNRETGNILTIGNNGAYFKRLGSGWCSGGSDSCPESISYLDLGMLPTVQAVDSLPRSLIQLNLSNVPRPPNGAFINDDSMDLLTFIDYCCQNAGVDYLINFSPYQDGSSYTGQIYFNTVSRKQTADLNIIKNYISDLEKNQNPSSKVIDYKYGEEFNESKTKTILIGGPQKRLHQMSSVNYGVMRHRRIFEPSKASSSSYFNYFGIDIVWTQPAGWANITLSVNNNRYVAPNPLSTRPFDSSKGLPWRSLGNSVVAQSKNNFLSTEAPVRWVGRNGSYGSVNTANNYSPSNPVGGAYSLNDDMIAPYFGLDSNNNVRTTFYTVGSNQFWVNIPGYDISSLFPSAAGAYAVSETELRYALGGFDSWWLYTTYKHIFGVASPMGALMYNEVSNAYGKTVADHIFYAAYSNNQKAYQAIYEKTGKIWGGAPLGNAEFVDIGINYFHNTGLADVAKSLHNFISTLAAQHYGKTFMIRLPSTYYYTDSSGQAIWSHSITDAAWENAGAPLDDLMTVDDANSQKFMTDDGRIKAFVGYNTSAEMARPNAVTRGFGETLGSYYPTFVQGDTVTVSYASVAGYPDNSLEYAHGGVVPVSQCFKTYTSCSFPQINKFANDDQNPSVVWSNDMPRAVVQVPGATISSDNGLFPMTFEIMGLKKSGSLSNYEKYLILSGLNDPGTICAPRAAMPVFAAIPMTHNFEPYGPWASHPGMIAGVTFSKHPQANVNNLVGGTSVEIDETMVPWEYGSMEDLDDVGMLRVSDQDKYEQVLEYGSITTANLLLGPGLGDRLNGGPYVTSISTSIGDNDTKTTYNFRTFTRKIGFYNKEATENIRISNQLRVEMNRKIRASQGGY